MEKDAPLLADVFRAYYDVRAQNHDTQSRLRFEKDLEENLVELYREILEGRYRVGQSTCFIVDKPMPWEIFAADFRDRVVHHLLYNYLSPLFECTFIDDSYACRKGRGMFKGMECLGYYIRSCTKNYTRPAYILNLDIQDYFMSINRKILYDLIEQFLLQYIPRQGVCRKGAFNLERVLYLTREVVFNDPTKDCIVYGSQKDRQGLSRSKSLFHAAPGCGLPIEHFTSPLFSNIYLNELDQFVKKELGVRYYGRYADNFLLIHSDHCFLLNAEEQISFFLLHSLGLKLHPKKGCLQEVAGMGLTDKKTVSFAPHEVQAETYSQF